MADDELTCPSCGLDDELTGERVDDVIVISCGRCDLSWERGLHPSCPTCGRDDLIKVPQAVWEKARGTQLSITSLQIIHLCPTCDPERLRIWWDSGTPLPPKENPAEGMK